MEIKLRESFYSLQPTGVYAGRQTWFLVAYPGVDYPTLGAGKDSDEVIEETLEILQRNRIKFLSLKGDEPIIHPLFVTQLILELDRYGICVLLEQEGIYPWEDFNRDGAIINAELRLPYTEHAFDQSAWVNYETLTERDYITALCMGTDDDWAYLAAFVEQYEGVAPIMVVPVYGTTDLNTIAKRICQMNYGKDLRLELSLHKVNWTYAWRGAGQ